MQCTMQIEVWIGRLAHGRIWSQSAVVGLVFHPEPLSGMDLFGLDHFFPYPSQPHPCLFVCLLHGVTKKLCVACVLRWSPLEGSVAAPDFQ